MLSIALGAGDLVALKSDMAFTLEELAANGDLEGSCLRAVCTLSFSYRLREYLATRPNLEHRENLPRGNGV